MSRSILLFIAHSVLSSLITVTSSENGGSPNAAELRGYDSSDLRIRLQDYPNYSMKLDLGDTTEDPNSNKNVTVTFVPPADHGILIIVQYPRDSYESQSKSLQQAYRYFTPEMKRIINNGNVLCLDYLTILNLTASTDAEPSVLIQSCTFSSTNYDQRNIRNFFKGVQYYANEANQEVTVLRMPAANPNEAHSLKPNLIVTSYVVCSNFMEATKRNLYKECNPGVNPPRHQPDSDAHASAFCISSKLFCDGNQNCIHSEDRNGSETVLVGVDETDCKTSGAIAFSPLFPTKATSTLAPVTTTSTLNSPVQDVSSRDAPTGKTTTKRPWWKPIIPPWSFGSGSGSGSGSDSETTRRPQHKTDAPVEIIDTSRTQVTFGKENVSTPWYSPTSPFGTVIIFAAVVILVFGVCSFLAKVHSTRPVYTHDSRNSNCESPTSDRPFSAESNSFARQLIEMIEEEELRNNSHDRRGVRPASLHDDAPTDFNIDDYVRAEVRAAPPRYIDATLPSYDSLFVNGNDASENNNIGNEASKSDIR